MYYLMINYLKLRIFSGGKSASWTFFIVFTWSAKWRTLALSTAVLVLKFVKINRYMVYTVSVQCRHSSALSSALLAVHCTYCLYCTAVKYTHTAFKVNLEQRAHIYILSESINSKNQSYF